MTTNKILLIVFVLLSLSSCAHNREFVECDTDIECEMMNGESV